MKQVILQENLKPVSTIGIGCMRIASMNEKEADTFIHTALEHPSISLMKQISMAVEKVKKY